MLAQLELLESLEKASKFKLFAINYLKCWKHIQTVVEHSKTRDRRTCAGIHDGQGDERVSYLCVWRDGCELWVKLEELDKLGTSFCTLGHILDESERETRLIINSRCTEDITVTELSHVITAYSSGLSSPHPNTYVSAESANSAAAFTDENA